MLRTFFRALGLIYLCAFLSLGVQARGLFGAQGILPLNNSLLGAAAHLGAGAYWRFPSLFWLGASDGWLLAVVVLGAIASLALVFDRARIPATTLAFLAYLSFVSVGTPFLRYQWDCLLLETGFLAIVLAIGGPERWTIWALRFLLFRLMLASGLVKLLSGDPTWWRLDALRFHYQTQPLPTPIAWYLHQLPVSLQKASCLVTLATELALPFCLFLGKRARQVAAAGFVALQALIFLSGNYGFFNWLVVLLCLFWWSEPSLATASARRARVARVLAIVLMALGSGAFLESVTGLPAFASQVVDIAEGWGTVSHYGLFAVMTTERDELELQGSDDGKDWRAYGFRWKPGDPKRGLPLVAPHMPRLDWQMWFAALDTQRASYWLENLARGIQEGKAPVLGLLGENPFPDHPPKHLRLARYRYRFSSFAEKRASGEWWKRELTGVSEGN